MISYQLKTSRQSHRLKVSVDRDGVVRVTAPPYITKKTIERFLTQNVHWIESQIKKREQLIPTNGGIFPLYGRDYTLQFLYNPDLPSGWQVKGDTLLYNNSHYLLQPKTSPALTPKELSLLQKFGTNSLRKYIISRIPQLHALMHIPTAISHIHIKDQGTIWGSSSTLGGLNFSWRLVRYAPEVIDYVLIHELAHQIHMDHSAKFWALVAKYDGNYKLHRQILNHQ